MQQLTASMFRRLDMLLKAKRLDHAQKFRSVAIGRDVQMNIEVDQDYCRRRKYSSTLEQIGEISEE
jgi:hypothetical protein